MARIAKSDYANTGTETPATSSFSDSASSAAGEAISKLAARFAAGTSELAQLVRKDQDLTAEADHLDKSIIAAVSKPPANGMHRRKTRYESASTK